MGLREAYTIQALEGTAGDHWSGPPAMVERIARATATTTGERVLDIGCGIGGPARRLVGTRGCHVVGVDLVEPLVHQARARSAEPGRLRFATADAEALPFASRSFDQTWCLGVVSHLKSLARFTAEAARVLRSGARLAVTEAFWDGRRVPRSTRSAPQPWRPPTLASFVCALHDAGFAAVEVTRWPGHDAAPPVDEAHAADLRDGRLATRLVVAWKP